MKTIIKGNLFGLALLIIAFCFILSCKKDNDNNNDPINNTTPTAQFTVEPSFGPLTTIFNFDASGCSDKETPKDELLVRWDWNNDGIWDTEYTTTKTATHQYTGSGNFVIKLEVKDGGSLTNTTTNNIEVTGGFYDNFENGIAYNWIAGEGNWSISNNYYHVSSGSDHYANTSYYNNDFSNFEYEVKMRKTTGAFCNIGIYFNGDPNEITAIGNWKNVYKLVYCTDGQWELGKLVNQQFTYIQNWDTIPEIINTGMNAWNVIKVAFSNGYIDVFINDVLCGTYFDDTFASGKVGLFMFDQSFSGEGEFDYVSLTPLEKGYTFGVVKQSQFRDVYSSDSKYIDCPSCPGEITDRELSPLPSHGNKYIYK